MNDVECPYCGFGQEICHDDGYGYEENELHEQQCHQCDKNFTYTTMIVFSHKAYKADCLNDSHHNYKKTNTYPPEAARLRCTMCGDEKPLETII